MQWCVQWLISCYNHSWVSMGITDDLVPTKVCHKDISNHNDDNYAWRVTMSWVMIIINEITKKIIQLKCYQNADGCFFMDLYKMRMFLITSASVMLSAFRSRPGWIKVTGVPWPMMAPVETHQWLQSIASTTTTILRVGSASVMLSAFRSRPGWIKVAGAPWPMMAPVETHQWLQSIASTTTTILKIGCNIPIPDSKVHRTNMGPTWVLLAPGGSHVGLMTLAIWVISNENYRAEALSKCRWMFFMDL